MIDPRRRVEEIPLKLKLMVFSLVLYGYGLPLRVLAHWLGVDKSTVWRWVVGLAVELYEPIQGWIRAGVRGTLLYLDEKWLKIKGVWHYWFVALDGDTHLPVVHYLLARRTNWNCLWLVLQIKRLGLSVKVFVTDGLAGYLWAIPRLFKEATHQLCLFHHQQNSARFVDQHGSPQPDQKQSLKQKLWKLFQTKDKRTVKRRLEKLENEQDQLGISSWLEGIKQRLTHLLPAIGSRRIPTTTNAIERFFQAFNRFYKVRKGFHSVESAKLQLMVFILFYLFTQDEQGIAPIERILPQARQMPLYQLMNDPLRTLGWAWVKVKNDPALAEESLEWAA